MSVISRRRLAGYALLEALIAVIVTSIGFIGAARLQTLGMAYNSGAGFRQKATLLVDQMIDRMRANQVGLQTGAYNSVTASSSSCLDTVTGCTPADLARDDVREWLADVAVQLPEGAGIVCRDSTPADPPNNVTAAGCDGLGNLLAVKVQWTDRFGTQTFVTMARLVP